MKLFIFFFSQYISPFLEKKRKGDAKNMAYLLSFFPPRILCSVGEFMPPELPNWIQNQRIITRVVEEIKSNILKVFFPLPNILGIS